MVDKAPPQDQRHADRAAEEARQKAVRDAIAASNEKARKEAGG